MKKKSLKKTSLQLINVGMILFAIFFAFCFQTYSQHNSRAHNFYVKNILRPIINHEYRNFEYKVILDSNSYYQTLDNLTNKVFRNKREVVFIDNYINQRYYLFRKDYFKCIDNETLELTKGINVSHENYDDGDYTTYFWHYNNRCRQRVKYFIELINRKNLGLKEYKIYNDILDINFTRISDTIINDIQYTIVSRDDTTSHFYNEASGKFDIPNFYTINYYYNNIEKRLQYIYSYPMNYPSNEAQQINKIELNVTFEDNRSMIDSIFDFEKEMYLNYSRHNTLDSLPLSWTYRKEKNENVNDTVLNYPMVCIYNNDTTTLATEEGWILLYFWTLGCKPCLETIKNISENTAKIGLYYMNKHNVKLMIVNPIAGNAESLKRYVERYKINHIIYHSKGFSNIFKTNVFPTIVLISPDKKTFQKLKTIDELPLYIKY